MNKSCLATIVYFAILGILIYNGMWIWLIIAILVGGLAAFIVFVGVALESGFRSKFPLDFLAQVCVLGGQALDQVGGFVQ